MTDLTTYTKNELIDLVASLQAENASLRRRIEWYAEQHVAMMRVIEKERAK